MFADISVDQSILGCFHVSHSASLAPELPSMEDYDQLMGRELESSPAQPSNETGGRTSSPLLSPSSTNRGSGSVQTEARSSLRRKRTSSPGATEEGIQTDSEQTPFKRLRLTEDGMQYHEQIMGTLKLKSAESQQLLKMYLQVTLGRVFMRNADN